MKIQVRCAECNFSLGTFRAAVGTGNITMVCHRCEHDVKIPLTLILRAMDDKVTTVVASTVKTY